MDRNGQWMDGGPTQFLSWIDNGLKWSVLQSPFPTGPKEGVGLWVPGNHRWYADLCGLAQGQRAGREIIDIQDQSVSHGLQWTAVD